MGGSDSRGSTLFQVWNEKPGCTSSPVSNLLLTGERKILQKLAQKTSEIIIYMYLSCDICCCIGVWQVNWISRVQEQIGVLLFYSPTGSVHEAALAPAKKSEKSLVFSLYDTICHIREIMVRCCTTWYTLYFTLSQRSAAALRRLHHILGTHWAKSRKECRHVTRVNWILTELHAPCNVFMSARSLTYR